MLMICPRVFALAISLCQKIVQNHEHRKCADDFLEMKLRRRTKCKNALKLNEATKQKKIIILTYYRRRFSHMTRGETATLHHRIQKKVT